MEELLEIKEYPINGKIFLMENDFTFEELDWIDKIFNRLSAQGNEVQGNFTREDIKKTLQVLLKTKDGAPFTNEDFQRTKETTSVKIIADFFLSKAIIGKITETFSKLSSDQREQLLQTQTI